MDKFAEHGCEFKNESDCEEELDDEGLDIDEIEELHYDE
jgi:hypothetical protein